MKLTEKQIADIRAHALAEYPRECCGIIEHGQYLPLTNSHQTPESDFAIDLTAWAEHEIEAIVHSHPDAADEPTAADIAGQIETAVPWALCSVKSGEVSRPYTWGGDYTPPLIGREFRHGPSGTDDKGDCYALIKDWYKLERNIELPEFPRDDEWWKNGGDLYEHGFAEAGFKDMGLTSAPESGDVVLMAINSAVNNHAAIYLGDGMILHHLHGRLSRREPACLWRKMFKRWIRHENDNPPRAA